VIKKVWKKNWKGMTKNIFLRQANIWLIAIVLFTFSCSPSKKTIKGPLKIQGTSYLIEQMIDNQNHFDTFKAKALTSISSNGKVNDFKLNIRIKKDSLIWVSITAGVGIEAARIKLTQDSVYFINRLNKTYFKGDYKLINTLINAQVDFDIAQALLTGNDFKWYDYQELKSSVDHQRYQLESAHRRKLKQYSRINEEINVVYQSLWLNPSSFKIERIKIKEIKNENKKIEANYSHFKTIKGQVVPMQYDIVISAQEYVNIDATLMKVELDESLSFPFKIPDKYKNIN
jgi:hypothetical protein